MGVAIVLMTVPLAAVVVILAGKVIFAAFAVIHTQLSQQDVAAPKVEKLPNAVMLPKRLAQSGRLLAPGQAQPSSQSEKRFVKFVRVKLVG